MSKNLNISVLVAARDEYIEQLKCIIVPLLIQGFNSIYQDAIKLSENKKIIYKFQHLLKQIPQWNQTILQEESKRIKKKCPYIMDIVTAIFVTNVKILASVRLKGSRDDIRVKIPTSDIFIHSIYIESAQQIFYDPFLFYHKGSSFGKVQENKHYVKQIIVSAVDETIRQMLPFDDILQKYLADALNENAEFGEGESETTEETVSDSDEESINNDDLPSDESESEPESEGEVKSFQFKNKFTDPSQEFSEPPQPPEEVFPPPQSTLPPPSNFFQQEPPQPPPRPQYQPEQEQEQESEPEPEPEEPRTQPQQPQQTQQPPQQNYSFF